MSNAEIRREARGIMSRGWFWRIACVGITLYAIIIIVQALISGAFVSMNVQTLSGYLTAKFKAAQNGLSYTLPSASAFWSMMGTFAFQQLAWYLFGAIFFFGMAIVLLKSVKNDGERWFADSFGGFARPFEVLWLIVLMNIKIAVWGLLFLVPCAIALYRYSHLSCVQALLGVVFLVPSLVAMYRYRQAWYLKSENPDWGAGRCLAESGQIMKGFKWAAFCLDLYFVTRLFFCMIALFLVDILCAHLGIPLLEALASGFVAFSMMWILIYLGVYFFTSRAIFYKAICDKSKCPAES